MAIIDALRKIPDINGIYHFIERCNSSDYPSSDWVHNPDLSSVNNVDKIYWMWDGANVSEMSTSDKMFVDQSLIKSKSTYDIGGIGIFQNSVRLYAYGDERWVTDSDDVYGYSYHQGAESGGTGTNPIYEWEHQGLIVQKNSILKQLCISGRTTSTDITELEFIIVHRYPINENGMQIGFDSDGEMINDIIYRDFWMNPSDQFISGQPHDNNTNDIHRRDIQLNYQFNRDGFLSLYARPTNSGTTLRYFYMTYRYDISL